METLCANRLSDLGYRHTAIAGVLTDNEITCSVCRGLLMPRETTSKTRTNRNLTDTFVKHLGRMFFQIRSSIEYICDPWWWPRGPGRARSDWGIPNCDQFVFESLCPKVQRPSNYRYCGFLGSVRALPGCPILVSIRPSRASFQESFNVGRAEVYKLPTLDEKGKRLAPVHFTDVAKFRQRYSVMDDPEQDMDRSRWQLSVECLSDEFDYLEAVPEQIIVVRTVNRFLERGGTLHRMKELRMEWRDSQSNIRLDRTLELIEQARDLEHHLVDHWNPRRATNSNGFRNQMEKALAATPPHDARVYDSDLECPDLV
jgi:hypothetical protein